MDTGELPERHALRFSTSGWTAVRDPAEGWRNERGDFLSLDFFPIPPDLPPLDDAGLRSFFEPEVEANGGRIVECRTIRIHGVRSLRLIQRVLLPDRRTFYNGAMIVPFARCSWVIKVQSVERGSTGMREAIVTNGMLHELDPNEPFPPEGPRLEAFWAEANRRVDDPSLDERLPDHPLSVVRRELERLVASITMHDALLAEDRLAPGW